MTDVKAEETNASPYKFLDYYTLDDRDIFFGRERETHILLSDVLVSRLVVLFARTGTGKTSLINAGVRPILEERGYATFFIRVREDPELSAELYITEHTAAPPWEGETLADKLVNVRKHLQQPLVLFFDQFEEFFLYTVKYRPAHADDFIKAVAKLYSEPESRIHIVFSMREEWFVEMDIFRTTIPKIFHNESNLRLRWFDRGQTLDAIRLPARAYNVDVEDELLDVLYKDLQVDGLVEPARLQIVCDTLWRETPGQLTIGMADYKKLDDGSEEKIATQVLFKRLEEEFKRLRSEEELRMLYALLPLLRTTSGTKYVRDIESLIELVVLKSGGADGSGETSSGRATLLALLDKLEAARFIRKGKRERQEVIELSHDYLVGDLDKLQARVKSIWPRRRLREAVERNSPPPLADFINISEHADELTVNRKEAELLLRAALAHGASIELTHLEIWFHRAFRLDLPVWEMFERQLEDENAVETSKLVIELLSRLVASRHGAAGYDAESQKRLRSHAHTLLEKALGRESLVTYTFVMLGSVQTEEAVEILNNALRQEVYASNAFDALYRIANSRRGRSPAAAAAAQEAIRLFRREAVSSNTRLAPLAIESLGRAESVSVEAVELLEEALQQPALSRLAQDALEKLSKAAPGEVAHEANKVLMSFLRRSIESGESAQAAVETLGRLPTPESVDLLGRALESETLASAAVTALERLAGSARSEVAEVAYQHLMLFLNRALKTDSLAALAVEVLGRVQRSEAVKLLVEAAGESRLTSAAQAALENIRKSASPQLASEAGEALKALGATTPTVEDNALSPKETAARRPDPSLAFIKRLLSTGQIIPFIGPQASIAPRPPNAVWHGRESGFLPTAHEMARFLADESLFPLEDGDANDLLKIASYYAEVFNQKRLNEQLREIYDRDYPVSGIHRFLARVKAPLLIFSTSFDDLLERAFEEEGREYDVVFHPASRAELMNSVLWWRHGEKEPEAIAPNQLFVDLHERTVIYKIFGSVDRASGVWDSYFITEADCVSVLSRFTSGVGMPPLFARQLRTRPFLYLGSGLRHWNQRVLLRLLKSAAAGGRGFAPEEETETTSYAVQQNSLRMEVELWKAKRVRVYDMELEEFVRRMEEIPET